MSVEESVLSDDQLGLQLLQTIYQAQEDHLKAQFNRSLPFQDTLFDRWQRAQRLGFGKGSSIYNSSCVFGHVKVGRDTWIGPNTLLDGMGGDLTIGDHCAISTGVQIYTHDTIKRTLSGGKAPIHYAAVAIGNCCQIAPNAVIAAGVTIGNRCIVAVNSFVNQSFPDDTIIGGCPARQIGRVVEKAGEIQLIYH